MSRRKRARIETRELDEKLKQQDDSESDQSERSKVTSGSPSSVGGRRESSASRNVDVKEIKKEDKVEIEIKTDDIEEINYKEMLNSLEGAAFQSRLPFDKMSSLEAECFSDLQGPSSNAFVQIRNRILKLWFEDPKKQLTQEYSVQKMEPPYNGDPALVMRTHAFLERHGFINYGIYERTTPIPTPPKGKQRPKVIIIGAEKIMMNREKLIEEVRKYPYLYDLNDSKYRDNLKKDKAWRQISAALNQPESECKKTWLNLRESHRRSMKKRKTKSGQAASTTKKWTFEDEMSFLVPHYKERNTISSVTGASEDDLMMLTSVSNFVDDESQNSSNETLFVEDEVQETSAYTSRPKSSASSFISNIPIRPKKSSEESSSVSHTLIKYLIDEKKNTKEDDEIDTFFKSIAATVKKFSEYNQAVIKNKIYNAVSEVELQEIADKKAKI